MQLMNAILASEHHRWKRSVWRNVRSETLMNSASVRLSGLYIPTLGYCSMRPGIRCGAAIAAHMFGARPEDQTGRPSPTAGLIEIFLVQG
jgi:hypothetical protein